MVSTPNESGPWEAPRISADLWNRFLDQLDRHAGPNRHPDRRRGDRLAYRVNDGVMAVFSEPGRGEMACLVRPRNIAAGGISFLHEMFVPDGLRCMLVLPNRTGAYLQIEGTVAACGHIHGRLHEIRVVFDEPIDPRQIAIQPDPAEQSV